MRTFLTLAAKLIIVWLALTLVIFAMARWFFASDNDFSKMTAETTGFVTEKLPDNHQKIRFRYSVNAADYSGVGATDFGNPSFDEISIGHKIIVFYDPENPARATSGDRRSEGDANAGPIILATLLAPGFILIQLIRKRMI